MLMRMLILGEFNALRTNCLQSSNILPGPVVGLITGEGTTVGSSRCHKLGVPRMSFATMPSPSSLPPMSTGRQVASESRNGAEERRTDP